MDKEVRFKGSSVKGVLDEEKANELCESEYKIDIKYESTTCQYFSDKVEGFVWDLIRADYETSRPGRCRWRRCRMRRWQGGGGRGRSTTADPTRLGRWKGPLTFQRYLVLSSEHDRSAEPPLLRRAKLALHLLACLRMRCWRRWRGAAWWRSWFPSARRRARSPSSGSWCWGSGLFPSCKMIFKQLWKLLWFSEKKRKN